MAFNITAIFVTSNTQIKIYPSPEALASAAAKRILDIVQISLQGKGIFRLVLAGGKTPKQSYIALAKLAKKSNFDWKHVHIYWGDERMVQPDHRDSNYRMAKENLLDQISIPESNIYRMNSEMAPEVAAQAYEKAISSEFQHEESAFDLTLLGLGEDGHMASIFPNSSALNMTKRNVVAVYSEAHDNWRLTMTLSLINRSKNIIFMVSGKKKAAILAAIHENPENNKAEYPASQINLKEGNIYWLLDEAAAGQINQI